MSYTKVCIHYVWATKNRVPVLTHHFRNLLFAHIKQNAEQKKIQIDIINGHLDHIHCLIWLQPSQSIDEIAKLIKGESAHWFNNRSGIKNIKLQWQETYFAVSISESMVPNVRAYIENQETHHQKRSFTEEYEMFIQKYDFKGL